MSDNLVRLDDVRRKQRGLPDVPARVSYIHPDTQKEVEFSPARSHQFAVDAKMASCWEEIANDATSIVRLEEIIATARQLAAEASARAADTSRLMEWRVLDQQTAALALRLAGDGIAASARKLKE